MARFPALQNFAVGRVARTALALVGTLGVAHGQRTHLTWITDLAAIGDADLDGIGDVVLKLQGDAYLVSGGTGRRILEVSGPRAWLDRSFEQDGTVAATGDVDGDGRADFALVWNPAYPDARALAHVIAARHGGVLVGLELPEARPGDSLTIAAAGDVDGDGRADLVVGLPDHLGRRGLARAFSGADWLALWTVHGATPDQHLGSAFAATGDVDGDGRDDVAVAAPGRWMSGVTRRVGDTEIVLVSGASGTIVRRFEPRQAGLSDKGRLGMPLGAISDLDGDDRRDLLAAWDVQDWYEDEPLIVALSSASGRRIGTYRGVEETFDRFGRSMAIVGDVDGDGVDDVAIGDHEANVSFDVLAPGPDVIDTGCVKLASGATGVVLRTWRGQDFYGEFGRFLAPAGDLNRDGRPDVWIAEIQPARLHAFSCHDGAYLHRIDRASLENPQALGPLGR